jgi:hypothetical protein
MHKDGAMCNRNQPVSRNYFCSRRTQPARFILDGFAKTWERYDASNSSCTGNDLSHLIGGWHLRR